MKLLLNRLAQRGRRLGRGRLLIGLPYMGGQGFGFLDKPSRVGRMGQNRLGRLAFLGV